MKLPRLRSAVRKGFTLIELLTVIAIIGILAGMLSVVVPLVRERAARLDALNNCRQIATSYNAYSTGSSQARNISMEKSGTVTKWAVYLTQKNPDMNNAKLWFIDKDDRLANITIPQYVINTATSAEDPTFTAAVPKSWAVVANAPRSADSNYPLIWTRGLAQSGKWDPVNSPWKGKGGHVGFMNGNVAWYDSMVNESTDKGELVDYTSKQPTASIDAALGNIAKRLEDQ